MGETGDPRLVALGLFLLMALGAGSHVVQRAIDDDLELRPLRLPPRALLLAAGLHASSLPAREAELRFLETAEGLHPLVLGLSLVASLGAVLVALAAPPSSAAPSAATAAPLTLPLAAPFAVAYLAAAYAVEVAAPGAAQLRVVGDVALSVGLVRLVAAEVVQTGAFVETPWVVGRDDGVGVAILVACWALADRVVIGWLDAAEARWRLGSLGGDRAASGVTPARQLLPHPA